MSTTDAIPVFVVGSGRTGTNMVGKLLSQHENVTLTIEHPEIFPLAVHAVTEPNTINRDTNVSLLLQKYEKMLKQCTTNVYVDKSHTNIWLVEKLLAHFPNAKFIALKRNETDTVKSMLRHEGVLRWCKTAWKDMTLPNVLLGIHSKSEWNAYEKMTLSDRCKLRHNTHMNEIDRLRSVLPAETFFVFDYDDFVVKSTNEMKKSTMQDIQKLLNLNNEFPAHATDMVKR